MAYRSMSSPTPPHRPVSGRVPSFLCLRGELQHVCCTRTAEWEATKSHTFKLAKVRFAPVRMLAWTKCTATPRTNVTPRHRPVLYVVRPALFALQRLLI